MAMKKGRRGSRVLLLISISGSLVLLATASGCEPRGGQAPSDSVPPGTPVEVAEEPTLRVGVAGGDPTQELFDVVTPFMLPGRGLVVPEAGASAIGVFDDSGERTEALGGPGEGPGEFLDLAAAWPHGDTIEAFDRRLQRITRFFPDGSSEVIRLRGQPRSADWVVPGRLAEGWAAVAIVAAGEGERDEMAVYGFASDGRYRGEVGRVRGMARFAAPGMSGPDPLSPRAVFAVGGNEIFVAETLEPTIRVFDAEGNPMREVRWDPGELPSPERALSEVLDSALATADPAEAPAVRERLDAFPLRDRVSAFWDFLVDERGFVWVRPYEVALHSMALGGSPLGGPGPGGRWLILHGDGERVHRLDLPSDFEPLRAGDDWVVGIQRDPLGVESVRVHAVRRR